MAYRRTVTYIAECFWPEVHEDDVERGAERARQTAAALTRAGKPMVFAGAIFVPEDEVVFYLFDSESADLVREACARAGIRCERVVASVRMMV